MGTCKPLLRTGDLRPCTAEFEEIMLLMLGPREKVGWRGLSGTALLFPETEIVLDIMCAKITPGK